DYRAVGEHHLHADDMPPGRTILQPVTAGAVQRQHASHGGDTARRGIGTELPADFRQSTIELRIYAARLAAARLDVELHGAPHRVADVADQPRADRLAGAPRSRPAWMERQVVFDRVLHQRDDVVDAPRTHDATRPDFVQTGVAGI